MYDAQYAAIHTPEEFEMELVKAKEKPVRIIEVFTNRQANVKAHRDLWKQITDRLEHDE
jgi:2-succinyl-5-enolpyruvyl-6-hydroxy-3-cyclohexene-1-carboxylate synthase